MDAANVCAGGREKRVIGVLGGMGPLASAEFLKTIYQCSLGEREQDAPAVLLYSDPSVPDRTDALLNGGREAVLKALADSLRRLFEFGASRAVICCVTAHHLLSELPADLRGRVISLLDVVFDYLAGSREKHLLVCTNGTRELRIFQSHAGWRAARDRVVLPDPADQDLIHREIIYGIKKNRDLDQVSSLLESLLLKYGAGSFISGCTELHLVARRLTSRGAAARGPLRCLDPLTILAQEIAEERI